MFNLLRNLMSLAEKIKTLTEQEIKEGKAVVAACESLKESLASTTAKFAAAEARIAELVSQIGDIPQVQAELTALRVELADAKKTIAEADLAADMIADINQPATEESPIVVPEDPTAPLEGPPV
jgi:seryl-tRNA synthetase